MHQVHPRIYVLIKYFSSHGSMLTSKPKCVTLNGHQDVLEEGVNETMISALVCIELQLKGSIGNCDDM